nr:hypothetical protein [Tanacetum cinerariifolium]
MEMEATIQEMAVEERCILLVVKYATCTLLGGALTWWNSYAIQIANSLMDQKIRVFAAKQADNKTRMKNNPRDDHAQQPTYKMQNVARAYTAGPDEKKDECPELKNQNRRNQAGSSEEHGRVYGLGGGEANQDPSNIADNADA